MKDKLLTSKIRLQHIQVAIRQIQKYVEDENLDSFLENEQQLKVTGVFEDLTRHSHYRFDFNVESIDEMLDKMAEGYEVPTEQDRKDLKERLKKQFGKQNIKDMVEPMYDYLPGKSVKVGDSWKESRTIKSTFEFTLNSTYTLQSIEGDKVTIEIDSDLSTGENGSSFY